MTITPSNFGAFLKCPTKCWLHSTGKPPADNPYAGWVQAETESYRAKAGKQLVANVPANERAELCSRREEAHYSAEHLKTAKWLLALDVPVQTEFRSSRGSEAQTSPPENS